MTLDRAWVRLSSGRRLDLLDPRPDQWDDRDLAVGLSRTYRWGGHSKFDIPLTVAQHSILVLIIRQQMHSQHILSSAEALRELLHDAEEGFLGFDPILPLKQHLGGEFHALNSRLRAAIAARYALPDWRPDDHMLHKRADHLAAASEAFHIAGWSFRDVAETLNIQVTPLQHDPMRLLGGLHPWVPWPAKLAAALFLAKLRELKSAAYLDAPADLTAAVKHEAVLSRLAEAFARLPPRTRRRCPHAPTGSGLTDTFVVVEADDISQQHLEGVIVDGERDGNGEWVLDGEFTVFTTEEELVWIPGWGCTVEIQ